MIRTKNGEHSEAKALHAHGWQKQDGQEVHQETRTYRSPPERQVDIYRVARQLEEQKIKVDNNEKPEGMVSMKVRNVKRSTRRDMNVKIVSKQRKEGVASFRLDGIEGTTGLSTHGMGM